MSKLRQLSRGYLSHKPRRKLTVSSRCSSSQAVRRDEDGHKINESSPDVEAADLSLFSKSKTGGFVQRSPRLGNQFIEDNVLKGYLKRTLPEEVCVSISKDLLFRETS